MANAEATSISTTVQPADTSIENNSQTDDRRLFRAAVASEFKRLAATTQANYQAGLNTFSCWLNQESGSLICLQRGVEIPIVEADKALPYLLKLGAAGSNVVLSRYLLALAEQGLAPGTIALRLAPLKWGVSLARKMGLINWEIFIKGPTVKPYKDVRGHKPNDTQKLFVAIKGSSEIDLRDKAIVLLLACLALRRSEITNLKIIDFDSVRQTLMVRGKGQSERSRIALPVQVSTAISKYLEARVDEKSESSPLFVAYSRSQLPGRALTSNALYKRVKTLAKRGGVVGRVTPHGFRHCAITQALNALDGDIRRVSSFARHAKIQTTTIYDDDRQDLAGGVAIVLADLFG